MLPLLVNIFLFQLGWFACVYLGSTWAVPVSFGILFIHFFVIVRPSEINMFDEIYWLLKVLFIGFLLEVFYFVVGALVRHDALIFPPLWLLCLWVLFATTCRFSLRWLRRKYILCALLAIVAAPISYYGGALLNSNVSLGEPFLKSLLIIGLGWGVFFPALMFLSIPLKEISFKKIG